jgi:hypothetical protein
MAAETIGDAVKKGDFSAGTLKNYLKYLHSTTLLDMVRQSRKTSEYFAGKGRTELPDYMKVAADTFNENWESEVDYISKESHPLLRNLYSRIGQNFVPRLIRWPINAAIGISNFHTNLVEKIRRKLRSHYYAWKEQPYS